MMAVGSRKISRDSTTDPSAELGGLAVTDFTPSAVSCWLRAVVGGPGMTVV